MIIEDKEVASSIMDGRPWEAGKFSLSLRLSLWAEHLGLLPGEVSCIMDPVDDSAYKNIWMATAKVSVVDIWYLEAVLLNSTSWRNLF